MSSSKNKESGGGGGEDKVQKHKDDIHSSELFAVNNVSKESAARSDGHCFAAGSFFTKTTLMRWRLTGANPSLKTDGESTVTARDRKQTAENTSFVLATKSTKQVSLVQPS